MSALAFLNDSCAPAVKRLSDLSLLLEAARLLAPPPELAATFPRVCPTCKAVRKTFRDFVLATSSFSCRVTSGRPQKLVLVRQCSCGRAARLELAVGRDDSRFGQERRALFGACCARYAAEHPDGDMEAFKKALRGLIRERSIFSA